MSLLSCPQAKQLYHTGSLHLLGHAVTPATLRDVTKCSFSMTGTVPIHVIAFAPHLTTSVMPPTLASLIHVGAPGRLIIWCPLKLLFFKLFWPVAAGKHF